VYVFSSAQPSIRYDEPILETSSDVPQGYLGGLAILPLIIFPFFFIWKDFAKGTISWDHLGEFYRLYAFIVYMTISLIRIFYFLPHPWYLEMFYIFIPYLMYKDYKEAKNDQQKIQEENQNGQIN
jgi:predicted membrane protein